MPGYTVATSEFRAALASVVVHAGKDPLLPMLERVRLDVDSNNVVLTATDRFSVGMAKATVITHTQPELDPIDLYPEDAKKILGLFKPGKESDGEPQYLMTVETTDTHVVITDVSGLVDGRVLKLPKIPVDDRFPDVQMLISRCVHQPLAAADDLIVSGKYFTRFTAASGHYSDSLKLETHAGWRALLVRCGGRFLGLLLQEYFDEDDSVRADRWASTWLTELPDPTGIPRGSTRPSNDSGTRIDLKDGVGFVIHRPSNEDTEVCSHEDCSNTLDDGEGYDGLCGEHADQTDETDLEPEAPAPDTTELDRLLRAVELVVESQFGSATMLQRKLWISYAAAQRVMTVLEDNQIVSPLVRGKTRTVLVDRSGLHAALEALRAQYKTDPAP
jgi:hypothetical protein